MKSVDIAFFVQLANCSYRASNHEWKSKWHCSPCVHCISFAVRDSRSSVTFHCVTSPQKSETKTNDFHSTWRRVTNNEIITPCAIKTRIIGGSCAKRRTFAFQLTAKYCSWMIPLGKLCSRSLYASWRMNWNALNFEHRRCSNYCYRKLRNFKFIVKS